MSSFHRILLVCAAFALSASGCATASPRVEVPRIHPAWEVHMSAGLDAAEVGQREDAARHYRRAVDLARLERLPIEELAFSAYRLGDLIRTHPGLARNESALELLDEARRGFEQAYGSEHPVLLPVWARIARLHEEAGQIDAAAEARATADRIAVRFFPEAHFLRERFGAARPAEIVHPLEVLAMLGEEELGAETDEPEQVVQSPN